MPAIGYVSRNDKGFKGNLKTLSIKAPIEFIVNTSKTNDKQPDYIVLVDGVEVGAAWNRVSKHSGNDYVSLQLSAPEFGPRKLYANLGQAAGQDDPDTFGHHLECRRLTSRGCPQAGRPLPLLSEILERTIFAILQPKQVVDLLPFSCFIHR
ncbi:DUF736 domain-containing protein [Pelagibius sp. Alg239-R121]|uniref:DUF736 domain-containing protein n=1 Tax=Pelagibius sp. Alg239-R121 TaxID=2993448 RepID=UPI0024A78297|nr:DUF736 domain-containing protein [Pelagibius sp. Alg239-R121]